MMRGLPRREYTLDFKQDAVRRAREHGPCATARALGLPEQTLRNWIRAGLEGRPVGAEQPGADITPARMEQTRAQAEEARRHRRQLLRDGVSPPPSPQPMVPPRTQALHSPMLPLPRLHRH
ncbi:hypothetical protein CDN99_20815 [Roseateles aquatilis]|uniref:Transposase n=1 Tax=Roseateles aquatilis TaxID=431061 RepID=A0A246J0Z7_9BURK|nr:transposase [Roseateles aquatilis]OWQ86277.1 hypothetical protein CDN99_20815 [Roseateles aquatilis]